MPAWRRTHDARAVDLDEMVKQDGGDQAGGADEAKQLNQCERFTWGGGGLLRGHESFLEDWKKRNGTRVRTRRMPIGANPRVSADIIAARARCIAYRAEMD
jgi:hypothetical protein